MQWYKLQEESNENGKLLPLKGKTCLFLPDFFNTNQKMYFITAASYELWYKHVQVWFKYLF